MPKAATTIEDQIQARVEDFATELSTLVRQAAMEAVSGALNGTATATRPSRKAKPGRPRAAGKATRKAAGGKRIRRTTEDLEKLGDKLVSFVGKNPGSRLEVISAGVGIASGELKKPVADLLAAKQLKKTGQKRGTAYWVVTK